MLNGIIPGKSVACIQNTLAAFCPSSDILVQKAEKEHMQFSNGELQRVIFLRGG